MADPVLAKRVVVDTIVLSGPGRYYGARLSATAAANLLAYDGLSAAGVLIDKSKVAANKSNGEQLEHPIHVKTGIFIDLAGSGFSGTVWYRGG